MTTEEIRDAIAAAREEGHAEGLAAALDLVRKAPREMWWTERFGYADAGTRCAWCKTEFGFASSLMAALGKFEHAPGCPVGAILAAATADDKETDQ